MGTAQSTPTRKITIPNEESQFIKISESVAERLRKCTETSPQDMMKNQPKDECEPAENHFKNVKNSEPNPECKVFDNCFSSPPSNSNWGLCWFCIYLFFFCFTVSGDALINYYYGPSIASIRLLQEKEKELKESEEYWTKRIANMEKHHARLNQIMKNEYNKAIVEISCQSPRVSKITLIVFL